MYVQWPDLHTLCIDVFKVYVEKNKENRKGIFVSKNGVPIPELKQTLVIIFPLFLYYHDQNANYGVNGWSKELISSHLFNVSSFFRSKSPKQHTNTGTSKRSAFWVGRVAVASFSCAQQLGSGVQSV